MVNNSLECLYPNTIYIILAIIIIVIIKDIRKKTTKALKYLDLDISKLSFKYNTTLENLESIIKYLLEPTSIFTTDSTRLIIILNKLSIINILELREIEEIEELKEIEELRRIREIEEEEEREVSPITEEELKRFIEEESRLSKRSTSTKRTRTPPRIIENLILSPNPRDKKVSRKGKEKE